MNIGGVLPIVIVASVLVFAPLSAWLADRRDRSVGVWLVLGALAGPLAAAIVAVAPPGRCAACGTGVSGWPERCASCGANLTPGAGPSTATAPPAGAGPPARPRPSKRATPVAGPPTVPSDLSRPAVGRAGTARPSRSASPRRPPAVSESAGETVMLATAVYVTGSRDCQPGLHYLLALRGPWFVVLGPLEQDPNLVAVERRLVELSVTAYGAGLLISDHGPSLGWSLGFQNLAGGTPASVEQTMIDAGSIPGVQ